ncbi:cAMP-regulated phosphoprotein 21 isoform X3 [Nerophis lumbriciformis]|uniref:cAMP-regulated phosphoprotein 21 isoform X3 n=1 Tax=Nerophis lumbriciformis TaxID=546530 RepID=UPI002AE0678A|nr:cAMP-regulated phosphoprotein 21-like isoform X4 [Nerophis lumbriciformis]
MDAAVEVDDARHVPSCDVISHSTPPPFVRPLCSTPKQDDGSNPELQTLCNPPKKKAKARGKLVRSMAVCEESKEEQQTTRVTSPTCNQDHSASCKEEEQQEKLSKDCSVEYTDSTGIDLQLFIRDTLNRNPRDRMMLLKLEQDMIDFITGESPFKKFPHMSSYHRMLVHRVAAYFGMEHNVDQTGKSVIINRTSSTRIPEQRFLDQVHEDKASEIQHWKSILKRDNSSDEQQTRRYASREKHSKSVEEREEEYQRARDRIFSQEPPCTQEGGHAENRTAEECNPYAETQRKRQLFRGSRDSSGSSWTGSSRQSSTEADCRCSNEPRPWSSTDSDSSYQWTNPAPKPRQATNPGWDARGSISLFRLPPTSTPPNMAEPAPNPAYIQENGIPPGSILVNPHTGQPFLNPDGSPVVYNPPAAPQPIASQASQQVYSSVSYPAPQTFPTQVEELSSQFAHVTVGEAPPLYPPGQSFIYAAPPPPPPPANPHSYCQPSPQVPTFYYSQYPTSVQHPVKAASPSCSQATGYAPVVGVQQPSHPVLGGYTPLAPHHCSIVQVTQEHGHKKQPVRIECFLSCPQGGVSFPQSKLGETAYCCMVPPHCAHPAGGLSGPAWTA